MAIPVVTGAKLICPLGTGPGTLIATSQGSVLIGGKPACTIQDIAPITSVTPFAMCTTQTNPAVAAATAAALGTPTPAPCVPATSLPWSGGAKVLVCGKTVLTNDAQLTCAYGGSITIADPGQSTAICG